MAKLYHVTVAADYRWSVATVGGRPFSKHGATPLNDAQMTDEIKSSPILTVVEVEDSGPEPINATDAAIAYAAEKGVELSIVVGSGAGGRILKSDVEAFVDEEG